ncbi:MAG: hypothetical protein QNJ47_02560 [Nostocaceae cyanobacterium]|nr:hypothetical protein [Nostocaceae cyanobacterium]
MSLLRRIPWVSLILLLLTYITLGWLISISTVNVSWWKWIWGLTVAGILLLVGGLTTPWAMLTDYFRFPILFQSNPKSFAMTLFGAFLLFLILAKFRLFLDILLIISATMLARLDFQTAEFTEVQSFVIISVFSLAGLGLGTLVEKLMSHIFNIA